MQVGNFPIQSFSWIRNVAIVFSIRLPTDCVKQIRVFWINIKGWLYLPMPRQRLSLGVASARAVASKETILEPISILYDVSYASLFLLLVKLRLLSSIMSAG